MLDAAGFVDVEVRAGYDRPPPTGGRRLRRLHREEVDAHAVRAPDVDRLQGCRGLRVRARLDGRCRLLRPRARLQPARARAGRDGARGGVLRVRDPDRHRRGHVRPAALDHRRRRRPRPRVRRHGPRERRVARPRRGCRSWASPGRSRAAPTRPGSRTRSGSSSAGRSFQAGAQAMRIGRVDGDRGRGRGSRSSISACRSSPAGSLCSFSRSRSSPSCPRPASSRRGPRASPRPHPCEARPGRAARSSGATRCLLLIVGIAFVLGASDEGFDRLWEAHFLVEVGVPGFGGLDQVVWFGVLAAGATLLAILVAQPLSRRLRG